MTVVLGIRSAIGIQILSDNIAPKDNRNTLVVRELKVLGWSVDMMY